MNGKTQLSGIAGSAIDVRRRNLRMTEADANWNVTYAREQCAHAMRLPWAPHAMNACNYFGYSSVSENRTPQSGPPAGVSSQPRTPAW